MIFIEVQNGSGIEIHQQLPDAIRATALGLANRFWEHSRFYGRDGVLWQPSPAAPEYREMSRIMRALARTIFNPARIVPMTYERLGGYKLSDLKRGIRNCVEQDDDILTQFIEADEILTILEQAAGFDEIIALLSIMKGDAGTANH